MSFHSETTHTARKRHFCGETGLPIEIGEKYVRFAGVYDGDFYIVKMKVGIAALFNKANAHCWRTNGDGLEIGAGALRDYIFDALHNPTATRLADAEAYAAVYPAGKADWMRVDIAKAKAELENAKGSR